MYCRLRDFYPFSYLPSRSRSSILAVLSLLPVHSSFSFYTSFCPAVCYFRYARARSFCSSNSLSCSSHGLSCSTITSTIASSAPQKNISPSSYRLPVPPVASSAPLLAYPAPPVASSALAEIDSPAFPIAFSALLKPLPFLKGFLFIFQPFSFSQVSFLSS